METPLRGDYAAPPCTGCGVGRLHECQAQNKFIRYAYGWGVFCNCNSWATVMPTKEEALKKWSESGRFKF